MKFKPDNDYLHMVHVYINSQQKNYFFFWVLFLRLYFVENQLYI